MKALVAAAVVATTMSGAANALTNNEMFLVAYDATATKTFIAALGQAGSVSAFTGNTNLLGATAINYSADANWTNLMSTATAGSVSYQVLGLNMVGGFGYNPGDKLVLSSNATPAAFNNFAFNGLKSDAISPTGSFIGLFESLNSAITGTSTGLVIGTGNDSGARAGTTFFTKYLGVNTTAALDSDLGFYGVTRDQVVTTNAGKSAITQYMQGPANTTGDVWNLSSAGALTYTAAAVAAVPEADTSAMFLAGLGLMGFVARRRTRA